jgi:hypothetical protein
MRWIDAVFFAVMETLNDDRLDWAQIALNHGFLTSASIGDSVKRRFRQMRGAAACAQTASA